MKAGRPVCSVLASPRCIARGTEGSRCLPIELLAHSRSANNRKMCTPYRKNRKLVHLLALARRNHVLQNPKLLIHLTPSPPLNQTMRRLPRNLPSRRSRRARITLPFTLPRPRSTLLLPPRDLVRRARRLLKVARLLLLSRLHLDDLPTPRRRRREREIVFRDHAAWYASEISAPTRSLSLARVLRHRSAGGSHGPVTAVAPIPALAGRGRATAATSASRFLVGRRRQVQDGTTEALFAAYVATGARCRGRGGAGHPVRVLATASYRG